MTPDKFRRLALDLPGVTEHQHMGHPDFRAGGRIIATLGYPDEKWGMVKLTPEQQRSFVSRAPDTFRPCKGMWGEQGATNVELETGKLTVVRAALEAAWHNILGKKKGG
ncbi:MAG TPA: MmcQ/YjbR family DNA-binding protein [Verrucomicrobiae bacterium]|nr:MmcQ/YjbR family DNA-binding protein [Verrucomicrobiae bacterium]